MSSVYPQSPLDSVPETVDFVGEQAGPVEEELKASFREVLNSNPTVLSAYLARVYQGKSPQQSVAVCIRSSIGEDVKLEQRLAEIFRARFRGDQRLDFLFVLEDQEARLREVCPAFYEKR
jgi:SseB protein C-terminal domain